MNRTSQSDSKRYGNQLNISNQFTQKLTSSQYDSIRKENQPNLFNQIALTGESYQPKYGI